MKKKQTPIFKIKSTGLDERFVSREESKLNYSVIRLVLFGFSTVAIANRTGLTRAQVQHRVKMYKLQGARSLFRNGETAGSQSVMQTALRVPSEKKESDKMLYHKIRNNVLNAHKKEMVTV